MSNWIDVHLDVLASSPEEMDEIENAYSTPLPFSFVGVQLGLADMSDGARGAPEGEEDAISFSPQISGFNQLS